MNDPKKLDLVILWHMHQPDFRDHASGEFVQPWVYLHAIKDYSDMAAHLEAHPGIRVVLNFTPVLLDQLEDYADQFATGRFRDPLLRLLAQPDLQQLDQAGRDHILRACFKANVEKLIDPYPAYKTLLEFFRLTQGQEDTGTAYLSAQYFGDLLSWYHIAWMGETVRRHDAVVPALIAKARGFSHGDRMNLLEIIGREVRNVIPRYRKLFEAGRIELTTTPEYHPIGPLLLSFEAGAGSCPGRSVAAQPKISGGGPTRAGARGCGEAEPCPALRRFAARHVARGGRRFTRFRRFAGTLKLRMDGQWRGRARPQPIEKRRHLAGTRGISFQALPRRRRQIFPHLFLSR
jgi:hypothetical protein